MDLSALREAVLGSELKEPFLLRGIHANWAPLSWKLEDWGKGLTNGNNQLDCRIGHNNSDNVEWEWMRREEPITWDRLCDWNSKDEWAVFDYKNLADVFRPQEDLKGFDWGGLGFGDRGAEQTNLWIGTAGSYTPCHFDTYGANFVSQVYGRKEWMLFPPKDTPRLHATRLPYEESSVYSQINFSDPSPTHRTELDACDGLGVVLEPGDVLFIPPKWWHFVRSLDFSISLNTWIELASDRRSRVEEAVLRSLMAALVSIASPETGVSLLNPDQDEVLDLTETGVEALLGSSCQDYLTNPQPTPPPNFLPLNPVNLHPAAQALQPLTLSGGVGIARQARPDTSYFHHLVNAIGHPAVLAKITDTLLAQLTSPSSTDTD